MKPDGSSAEKFDFSQTQVGFTLGGPLVKDKLFFFTAFDYQKGDSTKQTDPNRIDPALVAYFASVGAPGQNGPIDRTNDARVFLGKLDWQISDRHQASVKYNYTWAEQENGTFDVDPWATSANAIEDVNSNAVSGQLISTLSNSTLNEFRGQWAREDRPRPYAGPQVPAGGRPFPDTGVGLRGRLPLRHAVLHPGRLLRHAPAVQRQRHVHHGQPHDQGRRRVQPDERGADVPGLRERPLSSSAPSRAS